MREQLDGAPCDLGGRTHALGRRIERAVDVAAQDDGFVGDLLLQRAQAQGAVEGPRHGQLAGRAGAHGQADQASFAAAAANSASIVPFGGNQPTSPP